MTSADLLILSVLWAIVSELRSLGRNPSGARAARMVMIAALALSFVATVIGILS